MGSDYSKMGIVAISIVSGIEKDHILKLQTLFHNYSLNNTTLEPNSITRTDFDNAMKILLDSGLDISDYELLDRLFILLDESGDCYINYKSYLIGLIILINEPLTERLLFAFHIYDENNYGTLMLSEMKSIFTTLNLVTSFFGDPVLSNLQIKELVIDIFKLSQNPSQLNYKEAIDIIVSHPIVNNFINGKGTIRFGR